MTYRFLALSGLLAGCNSFTTVEEACLEVNPGEGIITEDDDLAVFERLNCYRRLAKSARVQANPDLQAAVEGHRDYLELNTPFLNHFQQIEGNEGFTGSSAEDRLDAAGYQFQNNTALLQVATVQFGEIAQSISGVQHLDFWFADPFIRPAFLQPNLESAGVAIADYIVPAFEDGGEDIPLNLAYYNIVYRYITPAIAEAPKIYPRNGQLDAPGSYIHLSQGDALEFGQTYGYPITFTVGSRETGLVVDQFSLQGPDGALPAQVITGEDAQGVVGLANTAILVPDAPMTVGGEYTAFIQIVTDQGVRRARTTFTIGNDTRPLPAAALGRLAPEELPVITRSRITR
jgi:hypothetical protein